MADLDKELVRKGSSDSPEAVIEQGNTTLKNATKHEARLTENGMPTDMVTNLKNAITAVVVAKQARTGTRRGTQNATLTEAAARSAAKKLIRKTKAAAKLVLHNGPMAGVKPDDFKVSDLGQGTQGVLDALNKLKSHVEPLDEPFKNYFKQQSAKAEFDTAIANLIEASGSQNSLLDLAPLDTLSLYEAKGRVIDLVEQINLVAKIAFEDEAENRAVFNKDVLLRARRSYKKSAAQQAPADPTTPTTTEG